MVKLQERNYQPSLIWVRFTTWYKKDSLKEDAQAYGPNDLQLYIYRTDCPGAYQMRNPKLYWQEEPMGQYCNNVEQDALWENRKAIGEVVIFDKRKKRTELIGKNLEEAWARVNKV